MYLFVSYIVVVNNKQLLHFETVNLFIIYVPNESIDIIYME